jgi:tryptophan synthase alpha chain
MTSGTSLEATLRAKRQSGAKLLVPYLMGGMSDDWVEVLDALAAAGADAVEVGLPFSDPMMDGPVIQEADVRALARKTSPQSVLDEVHSAGIELPIVVMTYYNLVFRAGHRRFARSLAVSGVEAALVPDLSLEELDPWAEEAEAAGVETVLMVAPSSPPARVRAICARARGFVYAVARMGVTGEREDVGDQVDRLVERIQAETDLPVLVGIGISTPEQAAVACRRADGVIIGSALVRRLLDGGGPEAARAFITSVRRALDAPS